MMDAYGVSKVTADARDAGGVTIGRSCNMMPFHYTTVVRTDLVLCLYDACIKLQELFNQFAKPPF